MEKISVNKLAYLRILPAQEAKNHVHGAEFESGGPLIITGKKRAGKSGIPKQGDGLGRIGCRKFRHIH